jgi:hypothetical protein
MMSKLIGLSLSLCIKDIITGKVDVASVEKIIANTRAQSDEDWETVMQSYCSIYWKADPERARAIATQLRAEGRIEQPRVADRAYGHTTAGGHWITPDETPPVVGYTQSSKMSDPE